jgi:predicted Zn-dependent protease
LNGAIQGFEARAFHPSLGNEAASGRVFLSAGKLRFQSEALTLEIPLDEVVVEVGKKGDEQIYFHDPEQPDLQIFTLDQSILDRRVLAQAGQVQKQLIAILSRRELSRRLRILLYFCVGCVLLAWFGSWATSAMVRSLVNRIPPGWEKKLGDDQIESLQSRKQFVTDSNRVAQLTALAAPLMRVLPAGNGEDKFYILEDETPNAFALPGGHVVVNTGLLRLADRPEEVLGVIAHELAHVTQKHYARKIISALGPIVIFGVFLHTHSGAANILTQGTGLMVFEGFSKEYETEADDVGWQYLVAANIDPRGMIDMFRKLKAYEAKEKFGPATPQAFSSHPAIDKRIARLQSKWEKLPHKSGFIELTNEIPRTPLNPLQERPLNLMHP